jgi:acyl-CoA synthetase (NDP forming)
VDTLMAFSYFPEKLGKRMAIISGPGGFAVAAAEACGMAGLGMADLSVQTISELENAIAWTGTSVRNPIDIGLSGAMDRDTVFHAAKASASDGNVDAVLVVGTGMTPADNRIFAETFGKLQQEYGKPFIPVAMPGFDEADNTAFFEAGLTVFSSVERAMKGYGRVWRYQEWKRRFWEPGGLE